MKSLSRDSLWPHGLSPTRLLHPWNSPGKSTGVGCHFLLQGLFPTQGSNPGLPHCRQTLYHLSHQGSQCRVILNNKFRQGWKMWALVNKLKSWLRTPISIYWRKWNYYDLKQLRGTYKVSPVTQRWKICLQCRRHSLVPWVGKIPWSRKEQPTSVFFPGKYHE